MSRVPGVAVTAPGAGSEEPGSPLGRPVAVVSVDLRVYSQPAVERACYKLTDRCWLELRKPPGEEQRLEVALHPKAGEPAERPWVRPWIGELLNELLDQQIRERLAAEAGPLRHLIVAQAFAEGNLLDPQRDELDLGEDPRGIATRMRG